MYTTEGYDYEAPKAASSKALANAKKALGYDPKTRTYQVNGVEFVNLEELALALNQTQHSLVARVNYTKNGKRVTAEEISKYPIIPMPDQDPEDQLPIYMVKDEPQKTARYCWDAQTQTYRYENIIAESFKELCGRVGILSQFVTDAMAEGLSFAEVVALKDTIYKTVPTRNRRVEMSDGTAEFSAAKAIEDKNAYVNYYIKSVRKHYRKKIMPSVSTVYKEMVNKNISFEKALDNIIEMERASFQLKYDDPKYGFVFGHRDKSPYWQDHRGHKYQTFRKMCAYYRVPVKKAVQGIRAGQTLKEVFEGGNNVKSLFV